MKIVVISPTYNEKGNIERMISVLEEEVFPTIKKHSMELLIADDNSPDGTGELVENLTKKYKNLHVLKGEKNGLGAAYVKAMKYAMNTMNADAVIELDSDFQHDPHDIPRLVAAMDDGYDYVIGSRYIPGGKIPSEWGLYRKVISFFGSLFARLVLMMFSIHDMTSGYKLTKTDYLKKVDLDHLYSNYYAYKIHILHDLVKLGVRVKEVPIIFYERKEGTSKITRKDLFDSLYVVIRLRLEDSKKFVKFLIVGGVGFILNAIVLEILVKYGNWHPASANLVGAALAIFSNYNFNNLWTFKDQKSTTVTSYLKRLIGFYASSSFGVIFIQTGTIFLGTHFIGEEYYFLYFIFGTGLLLIWNFTMYSKFIWRKKPQ